MPTQIEPMKHYPKTLFVLLIYGVMCSVTGAVAKGVSVGKCVAPLATFYCGRNIAHNGLRLCVCLPLAQCFNLTTNFIGQIAQNRCYKLAAVD